MSLSAIGLSEAHEALYRAALDRPEGVPAETMVGLADGERLLADLRGLGLLEGVDVVRASSPTVLEDLADRLADDLAARQRAVARSRAEIADLARTFERRTLGGVPADCGAGVEFVPGATAVRDRIDELSFFARRRIVSVQPLPPSGTGSGTATGGGSGPGDRPGAPPRRSREDERALRRGLDVRVIVDRPVAGVAGIQVRVSPVRLQRVIVIDDEVAVVASGQDGGALVVRQAGLLAVVLGYVEQLWQLAGDAQPRPQPTDAEREVLALLAGGATDEAMSRALGVSSRQARRRVARLMSTLGVDSRFAAGAEAARRGWL